MAIFVLLPDRIAQRCDIGDFSGISVLFVFHALLCLLVEHVIKCLRNLNSSGKGVDSNHLG